MIIAPWIKTTIALAITLQATTGHAMDKDTGDDFKNIKKRSLENTDSLEERSPKRLKTSTDPDDNKRALQIESLCKKNYLWEGDKKKIRLLNLFPHQDFQTYTTSELYVFVLLLEEINSIPRTCLGEITHRANLGDKDAQYSMGYIYDNTNIHKISASWHQKAAEQGHVLSQLKLGHAYNEGRGVTQDYAMGVYWLQKAADQNNSEATNFLAQAYRCGYGVKTEYATSICLYQKAIKLGEVSAQRYIKLLFDTDPKTTFMEKLPETVLEEHKDLQENLSHLHDYYFYYMALSGGSSMEDGFGHNPHQFSLSHKILGLIEKYQSILKDGLLSPDYPVDCLKLRQNPFIIPGSFTHFTPLISMELVKEVQEGHLVSTIKSFFETVTKLHDYFRMTPRVPVEHLNPVLNALKIFDPQAHSFLFGYIEPYVKSNPGLEADLEYERILKFLKKLKKTLKTHGDFAEQLNGRLNSLLIETTPYRNYLCRQQYPYLFVPEDFDFDFA